MSEAVRDLAYLIWEKQGRPHGKEHEHWAEAERRLSLPAVKKAKAVATDKPASVKAAKPAVKKAVVKPKTAAAPAPNRKKPRTAVSTVH